MTSCCAGSRPSEAVVLDVRPAVEYAAGHIPGAVSIPVEELRARLAELPADQEIVAYCRGRFCAFAHDAVRLLTEHGRRAMRLEDGMLEWRSRRTPGRDMTPIRPRAAPPARPMTRASQRID